MTVRLVLVYCCVLTPHLLAQTVSLQGRLVLPTSSSQLGTVIDTAGGLTRVIDRGSGLWAGIAVDARMQRFRALVTGMRGGFGASDNRFPERSGGEISAALRLETHPTFAIEARHTTRVYSSAAGRQTWQVWGLGGVGSMNLGTPLVRAVGALMYMPIVRVTGEANPRFGVAADLALTATPRRSPLVLTAGYRIEKFAFPYGSDRAEQFETLILSLGFRMRRQDGRWAPAKGDSP